MDTTRYCKKCFTIKPLDQFEPFGKTYRTVCFNCRHPEIARVEKNITINRETSHQVLNSVKKQEGSIEDLLQSSRRTNELLLSNIEAYQQLVEESRILKTDLEYMREEMDKIFSYVIDPTIKNKLSAVYEKLIIMCHTSTSPRGSESNSRTPEGRSPSRGTSTSPRASVNYQ
jgi:hypothetical protein